jgi:hypothetical protein
MSNYNQGSTLFNWDVKKEQQKADFMEHLFDVYRAQQQLLHRFVGNGFV